MPPAKSRAQPSCTHPAEPVRLFGWQFRDVGAAMTYYAVTKRHRREVLERIESGQPYELWRLLLPGLGRLFARDALDGRMRRYDEAGLSWHELPLNEDQGAMSLEESRYCCEECDC